MSRGERWCPARHHRNRQTFNRRWCRSSVPVRTHHFHKHQPGLQNTCCCCERARRAANCGDGCELRRRSRCAGGARAEPLRARALRAHHRLLLRWLLGCAPPPLRAAYSALRSARPPCCMGTGTPRPCVHAAPKRACMHACIPRVRVIFHLPAVVRSRGATGCRVGVGGAQSEGASGGPPQPHAVVGVAPLHAALCGRAPPRRARRLAAAAQQPQPDEQQRPADAAVATRGHGAAPASPSEHFGARRIQP